jgi:hypothetical protein
MGQPDKPMTDFEKTIVPVERVLDGRSPQEYAVPLKS